MKKVVLGIFALLAAFAAIPQISSEAVAGTASSVSVCPKEDPNCGQQVRR